MTQNADNANALALPTWHTDEATAAAAAMDSGLGLAAGLLLLHPDGRALGVSRKTSDLIGLPSGKVDPGETAKVGCLREVFEETGVNVPVDKAVWIGAAICAAEKPGGKAFWADAFVAAWTPDMGEPRQMEEKVIPSWVLPDELVSRSAFPAYNQAMLNAWRARMPEMEPEASEEAQPPHRQHGARTP